MRRAGERGQALVEMALVVVMFVTLTMGVLEFGRAFMIANMITHAAREGARAAAIVDKAFRDDNGIIDNATKDAIAALVLADISSVMDTATIDEVLVEQPDPGGIPSVQVTVNGTVPLMFNLVGTEFEVGRAVVYRDEGR